MIKIIKNKIIFCTTFFLLLFIVPCFSYNAIDPEEQLLIEVYEKTLPSIVSIEAELINGTSGGTGCIISKDGLILTSLHVIENSSKITVMTNSERKYEAQVVALIKNKNDLAILKILPKEDLELAKFGNSSEIKVGQRVLTIGCPFGFKNTLTTGIVSRIDLERNKIQTDAAINPGCSGGPLINMKGEIIGIGFALPSNNALDFIKKVNKKLTKISKIY